MDISISYDENDKIAEFLALLGTLAA